MSSTTPLEAATASPPAPAGRRRALRIGPALGQRLVVWLPPIVVALLLLPFFLRENVWWEWNNSFWLLERQADYMKAHGLPTLFVHHTQGVFYPFTVYYGGFTFAVLAVPAMVFGAWPTFVAATAGAYVMGYFGIWWTARNLGLSRTLAVLPALSFVCAPYMVATFYGRGAWAEIIGINAAAAVLGATTYILWHPERPKRWALTALVPATALVAGTHNLTLLMSAVFLPLIVLALLLARPPSAGGRRELLRQSGWVVAGVLLGAGLTMAWLLPNVWFGRETSIAGPEFNQGMLDNFAPFSQVGVVLSPWPRLPAGLVNGYQYPQPAVLVGAWAVLATLATLGLRRMTGRALRSILALTVVATGLLLLICNTSWWPHFPDAVRAIQMPVRLVPYLGLAIAGAACVAIASLPRGRVRQALIGILAIVVAGQAVGAFWVAVRTQSSSTFNQLAPKHDQVTAGTEPPSFTTVGIIAPVQFLVRYHPTATTTKGDAQGVQFRDAVTSVDATMSARGKVGDRILTPVDWSPYVKVVGDATIAGRDKGGMVIVRVEHVGANGAWNATVKPICAGFCLEGLRGEAPWQLPVGRLISFLSAVLFIGLVLLWTMQGAAGRLRTRRARRSVASG
jgi:hypothetical protein